MKTTKFLVTVAILATFSGLVQTQAQIVFSQTLTPVTTLSGTTPAAGTNRLVLSFSVPPSPLGDGTFTLTASGDLNGGSEDEEYVLVFGEDGALLGRLFDGVNEPDEVTETGSVTIPLSSLSTFAADGIVHVTVSAGPGVALVTIDSATLEYLASELVPCAGPRPGQPWKNHGQYVSAVVEAVEEQLAQGLLTEEEAEEIIVAAARSHCGRK
jgi:hypothetical protein